MKSVLVHGGLALLGLLWAYQTYTRPPEAEQEVETTNAVIVQCEEPTLARLELETPTHTVVIKPKRTPAGPEYWMTSQRKKQPTKDELAAAGKGGAGGAGGAGGIGGAGGAGGAGGSGGSAAAKADGKPAEPAAPEAPKPEEEKEPRPYDADAPVEFVANPKFDEVVKWAAPLKAVRSLGKLQAKQLAEFGLDKPETHMRLECGGNEIQLDVGGRTFGAGDQYVRDPRSGEVFLLDGKRLMDLQSAQFRFMQAELHNFTFADVDTAIVSAAGKTRRLTQRNRQNQEEARWVDAAEPDKRNELFANWFQRVSRMRGKLFLKEGQEPGQELQVEGSAPKPVVTIEYQLEGKPKGKLEIVRVDTKTKQGNLYYARTEATHRWVAVYDSLAKQVEDDVALVVGAEEAPAQSMDPGESAQGFVDKPVDEGAAAPALPPGHPAPAAAGKSAEKKAPAAAPAGHPAPATKPGAKPAAAPAAAKPAPVPVHTR